MKTKGVLSNGYRGLRATAFTTLPSLPWLRVKGSGSRRGGWVRKAAAWRKRTGSNHLDSAPPMPRATDWKEFQARCWRVPSLAAAMAELPSVQSLFGWNRGATRVEWFICANQGWD